MLIELGDNRICIGYHISTRYRQLYHANYILVANFTVHLIRGIQLSFPPGAQSWEAGPCQLGKVMGEIRRALSITMVQANAYCLMERLVHIGPGAGAAAKRCEGALCQEEKRRQDRQAFDLAWQSRGSSRVGRAFVP